MANSQIKEERTPEWGLSYAVMITLYFILAQDVTKDRFKSKYAITKHQT
jgi:hypothetical protein